MINKEEIIELASNFKFRSKEYNLIEKLGDYYLNQPKLDGDVGKAVSKNKEYFLELYNYKYKFGSCSIKDCFLANENTIQQTLSDKDRRIERQEKRISDLNDMLEITVIAEMLDLIKNGQPIPLTRKELQSKLDKYDNNVFTKLQALFL